MRVSWGSQRRAELPAGALPGERVLARAEVAGEGGAAVATQWALYLPAAGALVGCRLSWERIATATWAEGVLRVDGTGELGGPISRELRLSVAGDLPMVVRERVAHSVVTSRQRSLTRADGNRTQVLLVARRSPRTGAVSWTVAFPDPAAAGDPRWQPPAAAALAALRAELGID